MRASILSTTTYKLYSYIQLADQKAMALIIMNSIIVPVAMKSLDEHNFMFPATLAIITGVLSIFTAIICIFPKRGRNYKPDGSKNLLHFSDLGALTEKQYLEMMQPVYNDPAALGVEVLKDIQSGKFTKQWIDEHKSGQKNFLKMREDLAKHPIEKVGNELRAMMPWIGKNKLVDKDKN